MKRIIKKWYYSLFDFLMIYSDYSIETMVKAGFKRERMMCIANSLDSDKHKALRSTLKETEKYTSYFKNQNPTIIYCGRIQKRKKLEQILEAVALLKDQGQLVNAVFVGKDVDGVNLAALAETLGVSDLVWEYGPCYNDEEIAELFYNASVCVSPGNVGLTAIHALSFGCPSITHDDFPYQMPEFEAIRPGVTGDFFHEDDIRDLADKISKWTKIDTRKKQSVREAAFKEIDTKWNIHYQINVIKTVINKLT